MFGLQARTKQSIFLRLLKGEGDEPGFFTRVKAKKFARGKAMARRRLQCRCETKGRCLKATPCTWSGSFHDELGDPRKEASTRPSICAGSGLHVLPIFSIVFTVFLFIFVSFHFSCVDNARLHVSIPCEVFGRLHALASRRHVWLPWEKKKGTKCRSNNFFKSAKSNKS